MRRVAVALMAVLALCTAQVQAADPKPDSKSASHPLSEGKPIREIVPPKAETRRPEPAKSVTPREPVQRSSRQPTQPPRIQPNPKPDPIRPIDPGPPLIRPIEPPVPIGTIDPRPGTIRTHPGTIEVR